MSAISKILVGSDLSRKSEGALRYGAFLADQLDAELLVVHVVTTADLGDLDSPTHEPERRGDAAIDSAERALADQVAETLGHRDRVRRIVHFGDPRNDILDTARREECEMIVLTVESRSRLGKLLLGSHAQEVLLESEIPVVGVKPDWEPAGP